jgi:hypothetical protein
MGEGREVSSIDGQLRGEEERVKGEEVRGEENEKERRWGGRMDGGLERTDWDFYKVSFSLECTTFGGGGGEDRARRSMPSVLTSTDSISI